MENYVVSARKYRPGTFDTVVGQEHVTRTLLNEIKNQHLAQAFLFNGPRGVGKTTCARILAKEINRESVKDDTFDFSYNIFELDAASNNSVDDIRLLNEQVRIPPQVGKYKVYIIDEVHMLSPQAFNAFLKTLEEPPSYAIFILATTERHKILPTILSRCQIFNFNRIAVSDMVKHLKGIAEKENIKVEEEGLHIIAQKADGALRDALSIFDQMASIGDGSITYSNVIENLNVLDYDYFFQLTDAFLDQDIAAVLQSYDNILQKGFDGQIFLNGLASHFRDLMVVRDERTLSLLDVPPHVGPKYLEVSRKISQGFLINAINIANKYDQSYKTSRNQRLHVELALIKICYLKSVIDPAEKKKDSRLENQSEKGSNVKNIVSEPSGGPLKTPESAKPESESELVKEEVVVAKPVPRKEPPKEVKVARLGDLDAIFSEKPILPKKDTTQEVEIEKVEIEQNDEFNIEEVNAAINSFADDLATKNQTRLQSIFKFIETTLEDGVVYIHLNKQHRIQLEDIKVDFLIYMRNALKNSGLQIEYVEVQINKKGPRAYTSAEKFDVMAEHNPHLIALKDSLGLKIE